MTAKKKSCDLISRTLLKIFINFHYKPTKPDKTNETNTTFLTLLVYRTLISDQTCVCNSVPQFTHKNFQHE